MSTKFWDFGPPPPNQWDNSPIDGERDVGDGGHEEDEGGEGPHAGLGAGQRVLHIRSLIQVEEHAWQRAHEEDPHDAHEQQRQPVLHALVIHS